MSIPFLVLTFRQSFSKLDIFQMVLVFLPFIPLKMTSKFSLKVNPFWLHLFEKAGRGMIQSNFMTLKGFISKPIIQILHTIAEQLNHVSLRIEETNK